MECPHCNQEIKDKAIMKEAADIAMKQAINEGEKTMPKTVYELGKASSAVAKASMLNAGVVRIVDSFRQFGTRPEDMVEDHFSDLACKVNDAKSADLLIYLAQNLMGAKLVVSQHLLDLFEKKKKELLELIFHRFDLTEHDRE